MKPLCTAFIGDVEISLLHGDAKAFEQRITAYAMGQGVDVGFIFYLPQNKPL